MHRRSVDLFANGVSAEDMATERWIQIGLAGKWLGHPAGPYDVKPAELRSMVEFFDHRYRANSVDMVIDYEHQSLSAAHSGAKAPAAGWIYEMQTRENDTQLWGKVRWNQQAQVFLNSREYRYLSPAFRFSYKDPVEGKARIWPAVLDSVGLTNKPFQTELPAVVNSSDSAAGITTTVAQKEDGMGELLKKLAAKLGIEIPDCAEKLGLTPEAGDDDVIAALAGMIPDLVANSTAGKALVVVANGLGLVDGWKPEDLEPKLKALKNGSMGTVIVANALGLAPESKPEVIVAEISRLRASTVEDKAGKLIANAIEGKRIPPANRDWWLKKAQDDYDGTAVIVNSLPAIISGPSGAVGAPPAAGQGSSLTAEEKAVCVQMGLSEEAYLKTRQS